jgi:hypothetical protein
MTPLINRTKGEWSLPNELKGLADGVVAVEHLVHSSGDIRDVDGADLGVTAVNADGETAGH